MKNDRISKLQRRAVQLSGELETQLVLAVDLGLCDDARARRVVGLLQEVIRVLQGLVTALERRTEG